MRLFRIARRLALATLLIASLALNLATVAFEAVATVLSSAYETVTGFGSVSGDLKREAKVKDKKMASMSDELTAKDRRIASLSDEVTSLKKPKAVSYRGQKWQLNEAVEDTAERVAKRTARGATRNVASVFAESVPVVGIAAVVGVTAWELKDACDTMKDLRELELAFNPDTTLDPDVSEVCGLEVPSKEVVWQTVKASPGKAWAAAKEYVPDLPDIEVPDLPDLSLPAINWTFWN
jgi:Skp family chaperone for outer membrane proteins